MNKSLLRATVIACLPFCAMSLALVSTPAVAASKSDGPKVSRSINKLVIDAQKAAEAKDYPTVIAKCLEAHQMADLTDYDRFVLDRFLGIAYFSMKDNAKAGEYLANVVRNSSVSVEDRANYIVPAMQLASEESNYKLMIELGQIAVRDGTTNPDVLNELTSAYYQTGDLANALTYGTKSLDLAVSQNKTPRYALYQILAFSYEKQKDRANEVKMLELMVRDYEKPLDWGFLMDFSVESLPGKNKNAQAVALLDIYRLRKVVKAEWSALNYSEAASAADSVRAFGDKRRFLQEGIDKGTLDAKKIGPFLTKAKAEAAADEKALPLVEKAAKSGKDMESVADAYYGYGDYASAVRCAQKAIAMGGPATADAKIVLAMAQIGLGDEAAAKATLTGLTGDPAMVRVGELWTLYLNRKSASGAAPATP